MERILLLTDAVEWLDTYESLLSAKQNGAYPSAISFGVCLLQEPTMEDQQEMASLGELLFVCGQRDKWLELPALWQGESLVLMASHAFRYQKNWDQILCQTWQELHRNDQHAVALTGFPPSSEDQLFAMRTVSAASLGNDLCLHFGAGSPIRYSVGPVPAYFINTDFCFGPVSFFRKLAEIGDVDFLLAQAHGESLYTLHIPICSATVRNHIPSIYLSNLSTEEEAFCKRCGINTENHAIEPTARTGIANPELSYPMNIPRFERIMGWLNPRSIGKQNRSPLFVTAYASADGSALPDDQMLFFKYLSSIEDIHLLCYADPSAARRVSRFYSSVLEYKPQYSLQISPNLGYVNKERYARLCRPFLLSQASERDLTASHYIWIDFDYLHYPVYALERMNWEILLTDSITIAMVNGVPDTSMIIVPADRIQALCREILLLCDATARTRGVLPEEITLWEALIQEHGDWFDLIDLPGERELLGLAIRSVNESWKAKTP